MSIKVFYDNTNFRLKQSNKAVIIIEKVIRSEKKVPGDLNFIFTNDEQIREINLQYLEHDYFTDVITFNYNRGNVIKGEIYISVDTVRINAINYKVSLKEEVFRVMVHGVLHLLGYDDKTEIQKGEMREMEEKWIRIKNEEENDF